jgi:hypothetical protein
MIKLIDEYSLRPQIFVKGDKHLGMEGVIHGVQYSRRPRHV